MLLIDDLKDERPDTEGELAVWKFEETKLAAEASKLIARANLMGLYLKDIMQVPARSAVRINCRNALLVVAFQLPLAALMLR